MWSVGSVWEGVWGRVFGPKVSIFLDTGVFARAKALWLKSGPSARIRGLCLAFWEASDGSCARRFNGWSAKMCCFHPIKIFAKCNKSSKFFSGSHAKMTTFWSIFERQKFHFWPLHRNFSNFWGKFYTLFLSLQLEFRKILKFFQNFKIFRFFPFTYPLF